MKIQAKRKFKDLKEGVTREKGDIFFATEERFKEINSTKYGVLAVQIVEEETEGEKVLLEQLTVAQLKELLDARGIEYNSKAKKDDLISLFKAGD